MLDALARLCQADLRRRGSGGRLDPPGARAARPRAALVLGGASVEVQRVQAEGDWRRALELLAARRGRRRRRRRPACSPANATRPRSRSTSCVVTPRLDAPLVDRLVQRAQAAAERGARATSTDRAQPRAGAAPAPGRRRCRRRRPRGRRPRAARSSAPALAGGSACLTGGPRSSRSSPGVVIAQNWLRLERSAARGRPRAPARRARARARARAATLAAARARGGRDGRRRLTSRSRRAAPPPVDGPRRASANGVLDFYDVRLPFDRRFHPEMHDLRARRGVRVHAACSRSLAASAAPGRGDARARRRRGLARDAALRRARPAPRRGRSSRPRSLLLAGLRPGAGRTFAPRRPASARSLVAGSARGDDAAGRREERVPRLADVGSLHAPDARGRRRLRLGRELRRLSLAAKDDDGAEGEGAAALALLARDDARPVHRRAVGRGIEPDAVRPLRRAPRSHADGPAGDGAPPAIPNWSKSEVEIESLADNHLVAPSVPVAYGPEFGGARFWQGGIGTLSRPLERGDRYPAWSYSPHPAPAQLARRSRTTAAAGAALPRGPAGRLAAAVRHARPRRGVWRAFSRCIRATTAAALREGAPRRRQRAEPVRGRARARVVVPHDGGFATRAPAALAGAAARRLRHCRRARATASTSPARWR